MNIPTPSQIKHSTKADLASSVTPVSSPSPSSKSPARTVEPSSSSPSASKKSRPKTAEKRPKSDKPVVRPPLKPVKGHVVTFEKQEKGADMGVCSCGDIRSNVYTDLVRHLKDLNKKDLKPGDLAHTQKERSKRRDHLHDRPFREHKGLSELFATLNEGPKYGAGTPKPSGK